MNITTLQVPISPVLRDNATSVARDYGFSSLQDLVRLLLTKIANRQLTINVVEQFPAVKLSKKNEKRYTKMDEDFEKDRNVYHAKDVDDLLRQLNS